MVQLLQAPEFTLKVAHLQGFEKGIFPDFVAALVRKSRKTATENLSAGDDIIAELINK